MSEQQPFNIEMLYLEAEHFDLIARSGAPLEPRERVVPMGEPRRPFPGLTPSEEKNA